MKIRSGFVSNSSTSSYVVLGVSLSSEEELKKVIYGILGRDLPEETPEATFEEKKKAVIKHWESLADKPVEYYKYRCDELDEYEFVRLYDDIVAGDEDEDSEPDLWELAEELWQTPWRVESEYNYIIGYELGHCSDDGDCCNTKDVDMNELNEAMETIKRLSGKNPQFITCMTGG